MKYFFPGLLILLLLAAVPSCQQRPVAPSSQSSAIAGEQVPKDADQLGLTNNPEDKQLEKIMIDDDAAMDEVDKWIQENSAFKAQGAGESKQALNERIMARIQNVRTNYEAFIQMYPTNADAYLAFGSFLEDIGDEDGASVQFEKSRQLNPKNPAVWNDLANYYGENSPITNAFIYYTKAIDLNSNEPVYYENFATTVYLFRRDAMSYYHITEPQVFDKALALYQQAVRLDPDNFTLMTDYAESYYGIRPLRTNDALMAWTNALEIAHDETEREAVYIHLARVKIAAGRFAEAQAHLDAVTNADFDVLKARLERTLADRKKGGPSYLTEMFTNSSPQPASGRSMMSNAPSSTNAAPVLIHASAPAPGQ
jgi:tetratricopeptide (TPR) repeat protein